MDALKLIDDLRVWGLDIAGVVITRYKDQPAASLFKNRLQMRNIKAYTHRPTAGYPTDINSILSEEGFGANEYIVTKKPLVIVTGPGPGSGKLATCLSQMFHDNRMGIKSGYAKFETFPIWNLPLKHPVNVAYEAATADLKDLNVIDPFHLEAYGETSVNYNRDVEIFPVLKRILEKVSSKESVYKSPTDMGVNRAGFGIIDDEVVREASKQEIIRRYFWYKTEYVKGLEDKDSFSRVELLMEDFKLVPENRQVVTAARDVMNGKPKNGKDNKCGAAIKLHNGEMATGKRSLLMNAT